MPRHQSGLPAVWDHMRAKPLFSFVLGLAVGAGLTYRFTARSAVSDCAIGEVPPVPRVKQIIMASPAPQALPVRRPSLPEPRAAEALPERGGGANLPPDVPKPTPDQPCPYNATQIGETSFTCRCSEAATTEGSVWGSRLYTADSSICQAAKHAAYWRAEGDEVTIYLRDGESSYEGTHANGVTSQSYGSFGASFSFR